VQGTREDRRARRAGAVAGSLAAAAVAAVVTGPPAAAEVQSKTRTDTYSFTASGTAVTCSVTSRLAYDTATREFSASTTISGPEQPECRASWPEVTVVESDGRTHHAQGYGGIVNLSGGPATSTLRSTHLVYFQACACTSPTWEQSLPK
jgi:hypothetical protein